MKNAIRHRGGLGAVGQTTGSVNEAERVKKQLQARTHFGVANGLPER